MKRYIWKILIVLLIWSCSNQNDKNNLGQTDSKGIFIDTTISANSNFDTQQIVQETFSGQPCIEVQEFVAEIESMGWIPDTSRLNKVGIYRELNRKQIKYFNNRPFYKIDFENSDLFTGYNYEPIRIVSDSVETENDSLNNYYRSPIEMAFDSVDIELFRNAKSIWAYFYREKDADECVSDGIIKQWEFDNSKNAELAMKQIQKAGSMMYFNTTPYYYRIDNKVIIFHTRAMAFSYDQRKLFERFKNKKAPNTQ